jgi:thiamine-monophosphate kinase
LLQNARSHENMRAHPLVRTYNVPTHRALEGRAIARTRKAHAMIDTSDGFLADLGHICRESRVGALLIQDMFPVSGDLKQAATQLEMDPLLLFLGESDDYELIITCPEENVSPIRSTVEKVSQVPISEVGKITDAAQAIQLELPDGTKRPLSPQGWDHFK